MTGKNHRVIKGCKAIADYLGAPPDFIDGLTNDPRCPVEIVDGELVADAEHLLIWALYCQPQEVPA